MNYYRNILTLIGLGILSVGSILQAEAMDVLENPILEISRIHNAIKIDGNLTELEWGKAKGTDYFLEIEPDDNITPLEKTKVKVGYDDQIADNLSIGSLQESQVNDRQLFLKFQYLFDK